MKCVHSRLFTVICFYLVIPHLHAQEGFRVDGQLQHGIQSEFELIDYEVDCSNVYTPNWTDNLSIFVGLDGSKQPQDVGINAHFGGRFAANLGIPVFSDAGIGAQIGTAVAISDPAVGVLQAVDGNDHRSQSFTTAGLFQRFEDGSYWGVAWDYLYESYYDDFSLNQLRGRIGWQIAEKDIVGLQGMWSMGQSTSAIVASTSVSLAAIDQISAFWGHEWKSGAYTEGWIGVADSHGEVIHVFPGNPRKSSAFLFGAILNIPLNDNLSIYGQGNFIMPADSGTVDSYLGFVYSFGPPNHVRSNRFAPVLDVAGSTSFSVDLSR